MTKCKTEHLPRDNSLLNFAKTMRRRMTKQERHLWFDFLRDYPVRFRRQEIIGNYIADFYCSKAKLVIEIDGEQHYFAEQKRHDQNRTEYLESLGIIVLRFDNKDFNKNFEYICMKIDRMVKQRTQLCSP